MDMYDTRVMLRAVELMQPVPSFLWNTFIGSHEKSLYELGEFDYRKGSRRLAPFVAPKVGGVVMERNGFTTKMIKFPIIAPERTLTIDDISKRGFGENVYGAPTPEERARKLLAKDLTDLRETIALRREWMVSQLLLNTPGKIEMNSITDQGEILTYVVDYSFTNNVAIVIPWSDPDSEPVSDISAVCEAARSKGGQEPDVIIMAPDVYSAYISNKNVQNIHNIRNFNIGAVTPSIKGLYLRFVGHSIDGHEMYVYTGTFLDDDGITKNFVPSGTLMAGKRGMLRVIWGPVTQIEDDNQYHTYSAPEVPFHLTDKKSSTKSIRITSRPMPLPENIDNWAIAKVL